MNLLKPYLLLGSAAFTIGFVGYWALSRNTAQPVPPHTAWQASSSAPAPDGWNRLRKI